MKRTSRRWSLSEIQHLKEKGFVPGRTENAVRDMKNRLGLKEKKEPRLRWPPESVEKLKELHANGLSARGIHRAGVFSFSLNAIQKQMCRLGLAKKNRVFKFPPKIREKFRKFLAENWEGKTPEDLMEMWNGENARYPSNKRKVVSYLSGLGLKIPYGEVHKIKNLRRKIEEIVRSGTTSAETLERIRLERMALMQKRIERNRDIWTGLPVNPELCEENDESETSAVEGKLVGV